MRSASKGSFVLLALLAFALILSAGDLLAHGGRFNTPAAKVGGDNPPNGSGGQGTAAKIFAYPGSGPQLTFREESWEYWWEYNADPLIGLRPALFRLTPQAGFIDFPFEKVTPKKRTNLVRFLTNLYRTEQDSNVREAIVVALGRTHDESALTYLYHAYENDDHHYTRTMALLAMGISQVPGAVSILESIFEDKSVSVEMRTYAAVALGLVGGDGANKAFRKWLGPKHFKKYDRFLQQAVSFGAGLTGDSTLAPVVRSALINKFTDDRITNTYLIISLGHLGDRAANALLLEYLNNNNTHLRRAAAIALGAAATPSDKDVVDGLIRGATKDSDNMVRNFCYLSLGQISGKTADQFLIKELDRVKRTNLPFVGIAVGLTRKREFGAKVLSHFVGNKDNTTRGAMAVSLGLLGHKEALGELRKVVDTKTAPVLRGYCALALGLLKDGDSLDRLKKSYWESNDVELYRFCAIALGLIGDRSITTEMITELDKRLHSATTRSISTAYNLGLIGDQKAIEPLKRIAADKSKPDQVRVYAVIALGLLADSSPTPVISKVTRNNNYTILDNFMYEIYNIN